MHLTVTKSDNWITPQEFRHYITLSYGLPYLDVACDRENQFGEHRLTDGLQEPWKHPPDRFAWCNCPYSSKDLWLSRAYDQGAKHGTKTMMLLPGSVGESWFYRATLMATSTCMLSPRVAFDLSEQEQSRPPKGSALFFVGPWEIRRGIWSVKWR